VPSFERRKPARRRRAREAISQPPAPSHPIARGRAGAKLIAHILFAKYGLHLPLHRQSDVYAREGIELDVSTLADWVGARRKLRCSCRRGTPSGNFAAQELAGPDMPVTNATMVANKRAIKRRAPSILGN
jgi:transposase